MAESFRNLLGLSAKDVRDLAASIPALHEWYRRGARDLPWRRTADPYAIWVSEVMLQQTRVATVVPYFNRWMTALPTVQALASAEESQVFKLWEGLGYYSRARNLQRAALEVCSRLGGVIPAAPDDFRALPGVGPYTAAAVLSIAFGLDLPVLDGNVLRVFARLLALHTDPRRPPTEPALRRLAEHLLPPGTAAVHNQALMELGALVCTPRSPACHECPLAAPCRARATGHPDAFPVKQTRPRTPHYRVAIGIIAHEGRVFIDRRPYGKLLGGLWEFPGGKAETDELPREALVRELREEFGMEVEVGQELPLVTHAYTHLRVTLHPFHCRFVSMQPRVGEAQPFRWVHPQELDHYAMPRANRKVIAALRDLSIPRDGESVPKRPLRRA